VPAPKRRALGDATAQVRVTYLVKRLELAIRSEMDSIVGEFGVTALQYTALTALKRHPGLSGAQLARRSFVSPQAGSEMVGILARKGLISRRPHETNRRVLRIDLTSAGEELLAACLPAVDALERRMLRQLSDERVHELRASLVACIDQLSDRVPGAAPGGRDERARRSNEVSAGDGARHDASRSRRILPQV
jgi:DNA-binding MarR family transcriptional regulator